ncbi:MAG: 2-polyprenyl-3-methyl-6-methoxy-1,4-benzoquinone monooxygenase [Betaproteobacteria bacterium]|nr:2-polyprenyl-3-methyl-6-methoxy-1,4-benzoquinone monooxygenase [Betaproteobacteria bacterium]MBI2958678.1 2-polyprenyl-3-methyl-6-methoxy-1,4-benzoquinone monooxygenase [Betaproteobacteria bacterium]
MNFDALIIEIDKGIRTVFGGVAHAARADPAAKIPEGDLGEGDRRHAAALMRVNHCGEVCAQALYQGQALASKNPRIKSVLSQAAREEADHLAWSAKRIAELGGHTSVLNPLWYLGSLAIGYAAGRIGDRWNLGFLAETERQVGKHLQGHLARLSPRDARTRALIETMEREELGHARTAQSLGASELAEPVKGAMRCASRVMTTTSYWI